MMPFRNNLKKTPNKRSLKPENLGKVSYEILGLASIQFWFTTVVPVPLIDFCINATIYMKKPSNFYSRKLLLVSLFKNYNFFLPVHNLRNNCMNDHFIRMTTKDSSITGCGTVHYGTKVEDCDIRWTDTVLSGVR